jgi:hypothetical protein
MKGLGKRMKRTSILLLTALLIITGLSGCVNTETTETAVTETAIAETVAVNNTVATVNGQRYELTTVSTSIEELEAVDLSDLEDAVDKAKGEAYEEDWKEDGQVLVLQGDEVVIDEAGTYILTGAYDGQILIDTEDEDDVVLVLNGIDLSSSESSPIAVLDADRVVLILEGDNTITDSSAYMEDSDSDEERLNGAIYTKADLVIQGDGSLSILAENKTGILAKDAITILDGDISIEAARNGIKVNDMAWVVDGNIEIVSGKDGIQSEAHMQVDGGSLTIDSVEDALHAEGIIVINDGVFQIETQDDAMRADTYLEINGGTIRVPTCYEGLESMIIIINDGVIDITASDDGINVADTSAENKGVTMGPGDDTALEGAGLVINGGQIYISSGGDGIDSNGSGYITGGTLLIDGPGNGGDVGLDFNDPLVVDGGYIISVGNDGAAKSFSEDQGQNVLQVFFDQVMAEGSEVSVISASGDVLMSHTSIRTYAVLVFSSQDLNLGDTVSVQIDGEIIEEVAISDTMTIVGESLVGEGPGGGGMGPGGQPGMDRQRPEGDFEEGQMPEGRTRPGMEGQAMPEASADDGTTASKS